MGHAGAIVSAFGESAQEKVEILKEAGVAIVPTPSTFGKTVADLVA
jgi:malate-CoA ligase subunit alpha